MSSPSSAPPAAAPPPDLEAVPVERRWLGLDRATLAPGLIVLIWAVVMIAVVPLIGALLSTDSRARTGDVIGLSGGVVFTPTPGWTVSDGVLTSDEPLSGFPDSAAVGRDGISMEVKTAPWDGSPAELLTQIRTTTDALNRAGAAHVVGQPVALQTGNGDRGQAARYRSSDEDGLIAAFVIDGTGVEVTVTGPADVPTHPEEQVAAMLANIRKA
jgi:hypothetical protein